MSFDLPAAMADGRLAALARRACKRYGVPRDATLTLVNISENAMYAVDDPHTGRRMALRIHRPGYHDEQAIRSELAWLDALRTGAGISTPRVLPSSAGERVVSLPEQASVHPRHAVMFEWLPGAEPAGEHLVDSFAVLGELTARMHEHVLHWRRPPGFRRFAWDHAGAFGAQPHWGHWRHGIGVGACETELLGRAATMLGSRLRRFGCSPARYGLIHADLRLANLLLDGERTHVLDFDDSGWGWYLYDLGAALSFLEDHPLVPELVDAWVRSYRRVRALPAADEAEIPTFVLMRRLLLIAWIGSHADTDLARAMGAAYTAASCKLAEDYLTRFA